MIVFIKKCFFTAMTFLYLQCIECKFLRVCFKELSKMQNKIRNNQY